MAKNAGANDAISLASKNLLASKIAITHRDGDSEVATVHPRRFRGGYDVTTENGRYVYESQTGSPCFGTVMRRGKKELEATIRPAEGNGTRIDIAGETYLVFSSRGSYTVDRLQGRGEGKRNAVHIGAARASTQSKNKTALKPIPFRFDFNCKFPALLVPILVIIIREVAATKGSLPSDSPEGTTSYLLSAPSISVSAAFGGATQ